MIITVDVTQEDIDQGMPLRRWSCPVARAVQRATGNNEAQVPTPNHAVLSGFAKRLPYPVPRFIRAFDARESVQPFSFPLDIPDQYLPPSVLEAQK